MDEVIEIELHLIARGADDVADIVDEARLAVRAQAHHLIFVAVFRKSQELSKSRIKQTERMRVAHTAADVDVIAAAHAPHHTTEVAEAIDGDDGGLVERRGEE